MSTPFQAKSSADVATNWPYAAALTLKIVCFSLLAAILLFLMAHWVFHSWSFVNILGLSRGKRSMVATTILIWSLYTLYVGSFIYVVVAVVQVKSLYSSVIGTTLLNAPLVWPLSYIFFGLALFPVILNMFAAMIKLIMDSRYAAKVRSLNSSGHRADIETVPGQPSHNEQAHVPSEVPLVYMMIPVYNEPLPNLLGALNGVAASDYPRLRVFVGYDKKDCEQEYFTLCRLLSGVPIVDPTKEKKQQRQQLQPSKPRPSANRKPNAGAFKYNGLHQIVSNPNSPRLTASVAPSPALTPMSSPNWSPRTSTMGFGSSANQSSPFSDASRNGSSTSLTALAASAASTGHHHFSNQHGPIMSTSQLASRATSVAASPALNAHASSRTSISSELTVTADPAYAHLAGHHTMFSRDACPEEFTVMYRGVEFTLFRFDHSGKLGTQRNMFGKLQTRLQEENEAMGLDGSAIEDPVVLFMDSDTHINTDAVSHLVAELHRFPTTKACTGFCVSRNEGSWSFWRILQDAEYIESMIYRNAESLLGSVTCLPGVLTMFRWKTLCEVSHDYFQQPPIDTTFEFARRYLGEDRYMSHLLMSRYSWRALGFSSAAVCKTEAPGDFYTLLRQRRRWYLGQVSNELIMLCTPSLWAKFPLLLLTKFLMMLKVGGSLVYLLIFELLFMAIFSPASAFEWSLLWWLVLILVPNWLFISIWCAINGRLKSAVIFPAYYWWNPLFMVLVLVYSIATVNERTWGGPRATATSDDGKEDGGKGSAEEDDVDLDSLSGNSRQ